MSQLITQLTFAIIIDMMMIPIKKCARLVCCKKQNEDNTHFHEVIDIRISAINTGCPRFMEDK